MKTSALSLVLGALILGGCASSPSSRISKDQAAFNEWPVAIQEKVKAGKVDLGFTPQQVKVALGEPDRTFRRTTNDGVSEVWAYRDKGPKFGFGLGVGLGSGRTSGAVGIGTGSAYRDDERLHVIFTGERVSAVETTKTQ